MSMNLTNHILDKKGILGFLHVLMFILSLVLVVGISIDTFKGLSMNVHSPYMQLQLGICIFFLIDFVIEFALSDHKSRYFATHFILLLVAIPYQNIIAYMGWTFSPEATYLIRFIPLIRGGYALAILVSWLTNSKASGLFVTYLSVLMSTVYFASLMFFVVEYKVNPNVRDYGDSIWWAFMDVTTIGSNVIAVTPLGRVLSIVLAALGMMMFPIFTVYITSIIEKKNKEKEEYYKTHKEVHINREIID